MASVKLPIETDASAVTELGRDALRAAYPGITFPDAALLTALTAAGGEMAAYARDALSEHDDFLFERLGTTILGVQYKPALQATAASTWTLTDTDGWTIPAGTEITLRSLDGSTRVGFETIDEVTIPAGSASTAAGQVLLRAVDAGVAGNGLIADPQPENAIARLASITLTAASAGGADAQDQDAYLDELRNEQRVNYPKLVVAADGELLAREVDGVDRALVLDTYDPDTATSGNPGVMSIAAIDAAGAAVNSTIKTALQTYLDARRISGAVIHLIDPTYTPINIAFTGVAHDGYDPDTVHDAVIAALQDLVSPANWGLPYAGDERRWILNPTVRYRDIVTAIETVDGFDYTDSAPLLNGGTADVTLAGAAPLPSVGTISGTVTPP
jgi:hypothetical protein